MPNIIDFNNNRVTNKYTPVNTGLELFSSSNVILSSSEYLYIDRIILSATGSLYSGSDAVVFTMITGSVGQSASAFILDVDVATSSSISDIRLTNSGKFSLNSRITGSISSSSGIGAQIYISLSRNNKINHFLTNPPVYDAFQAAKDKVRLLLYTKKGEVARMPKLGTRIYEQLLNFEQVQSVEDFIEKVRITLASDIEEQIPEIEIISVDINNEETDLDKNKIGISLTLRHKLEKKTATIDLSITDSTAKILKEHFINENQEERPVHYFG